MAGLDPAIHVFAQEIKTWMPGTRPGMTKKDRSRDDSAATKKAPVETGA
jgi:hypothetical protein